MGNPKTPGSWFTLTKLALLVVVTSVVSCAPRSNTLRNMAGEMLSPDVYRSNFENFERDDGLFESPTGENDEEIPVFRSPKPAAPVDSKEAVTDTPPPQPAPKPDAAGPALPAPSLPEPPRQPDLPTTPHQHEPPPTTREPKNKKHAGGPTNGSCLKSEIPCFPIAGKVWFKDDFGAARSGQRRHAGNDIFAAKLVPVVAIEDGVVDVVKHEGKLSGIYIGINHGNGVRSLYMHLNNDSPGTNDNNGRGIVEGIVKGTSVKKGQHIGWVGNSGNAESTPAHLHFELRVAHDKNAIRIRDFYPVNPFKMLREAEPAKIILPVAHNY